MPTGSFFQTFFRVFAFFLPTLSCLASSQDPNWFQFNLAFEPIFADTWDVYQWAGPGSSVGPHDPYLMGGWKIGFDYDLSPFNQVGVGFKSILGEQNYSFKDSASNLDLLTTNAIGPFLEARSGLKLLPHFDASVFADVGYYWLINSSLAGPGGGNLSGSNFGVLLGAGLDYWPGSDGVYGFGFDLGYQFLEFPGVSTPAAALKNVDGSPTSLGMSGFVIVINFAEISMDLSAKPKPKHVPTAPLEQPLPSDTGKGTVTPATPEFPDLGGVH